MFFGRGKLTFKELLLRGTVHTVAAVCLEYVQLRCRDLLLGKCLGELGGGEVCLWWSAGKGWGDCSGKCLGEVGRRCSARKVPGCIVGVKLSHVYSKKCSIILFQFNSNLLHSQGNYNNKQFL